MATNGAFYNKNYLDNLFSDSNLFTAGTPSTGLSSLTKTTPIDDGFYNKFSLTPQGSSFKPPVRPEDPMSAFKFGNNPTTWNMGLGALTGGLNAWTGLQSLKQNKDAFNKNYQLARLGQQNEAQSYNNQLLNNKADSLIVNKGLSRDEADRLAKLEMQKNGQLMAKV